MFFKDTYSRREESFFMLDLSRTAERAKEATAALGALDGVSKNFILGNLSDFLKDRADEIIEASRKDLELADASGAEAGVLLRLQIDRERILSLSRTVDTIRKMPDPFSVPGGVKKTNELMLLKMKVPLGVVGVVCDCAPEVIATFSALSIKTGNAVIFSGNSKAANTCGVFIDIVQTSLEGQALAPYGAQLLPDTSFETALNFIETEGYLDAVVAVGGAELVKTVRKHSAAAVIETGVGNCHAFIDESADYEEAKKIVTEAKLVKPWHCNSVEKLLFHKSFPASYIVGVLDTLKNSGVKVKACSRIMDIYKNAAHANEEDWSVAYKGCAVAAKLVDSADEAINHIAKYGSGESEIIVTNSYENSERFHNRVDAAVVYVNASPTFADGSMLGLGGEIAIVAGKANSRGIMGLPQLTRTKYIAFGKQLA